MKKRIIVGISGASGAIYGIRALEALQGVADVETHLVLSAAARRTIIEETSFTVQSVESLADVVHDHRDIGASIASGSFITAGMLVAPCSIKSLSAIANSFADTLLSRAADVCLKEKRPLILMIRETPLHEGHLELMLRASRYGAHISPPIPAFYSKPESIDDLVNHAVGKALDLFGVEHKLIKRWKDTPDQAR